MRLYGRVYRVVFLRALPGAANREGFVYNNPRFFDVPNGIVVEHTDRNPGLRASFEIEKSLGKDPNQLSLTLYNLAERTRDDLATKPLSVQLFAGYGAELRLLFAGDAKHVASKHEPPTWKTLVQVGDGLRAYQHARARQVYPAGTTYRRVIADVAKTMDLFLPPALAQDRRLDRQFGSSTTTDGPSRDELDALLAPFGYSWSSQNGRLVVLGDEQVSDETALDVGESTGMIGIPEFGTPDKSGKPPTLTVRCKLFPQVEPGKLVSVSSTKNRAANGLFRVEKVKVAADTDEGEWTTELEATPGPAGLSVRR